MPGFACVSTAGERDPLFPPGPTRRVGRVLRAPMPAFTDLRARTNAGEDVSFDIFTGKVVLVVNVARL